MTRSINSTGWPGTGGSGPVAGAIGITDTTSVTALKNYYPKLGGVEFVYDPITNRLAAGRPKRYLLPPGSAHELLAMSLGLPKHLAMGGTISRGPNGEFITTQRSGHYWENWTPEIAKQFQAWLQDRTGLPVIHH